MVGNDPSSQPVKDKDQGTLWGNVNRTVRSCGCGRSHTGSADIRLLPVWLGEKPGGGERSAARLSDCGYII